MLSLSILNTFLLVEAKLRCICSITHASVTWMIPPIMKAVPVVHQVPLCVIHLLSVNVRSMPLIHVYYFDLLLFSVTEFKIFKYIEIFSFFICARL